MRFVFFVLFMDLMCAIVNIMPHLARAHMDVMAGLVHGIAVVNMMADVVNMMDGAVAMFDGRLGKSKPRNHHKRGAEKHEVNAHNIYLLIKPF